MFFSQNEDYAFSKETALLLDLNPKYMILKKGNYKTRIVKDNIQIILNLSDK